MEELKENLLKKKVDSYGYELNDFQVENELTIEITLNEYRELIKEKAIADYKIKEAQSDKYTRESENQKLKEENKQLEMRLFEYRKEFGELQERVETKKNEDLEELLEDK